MRSLPSGHILDWPQAARTHRDERPRRARPVGSASARRLSAHRPLDRALVLTFVQLLAAPSEALGLLDLIFDLTAGDLAGQVCIQAR
jgi:hypothetical protein